VIPIGTRVAVKSVEHLGRYKRPTRLVGKTGVVSAHTDDGMNELTGLIPTDLIRYVFADEHLTVT
jgi:hypothetical protein